MNSTSATVLACCEMFELTHSSAAWIAASWSPGSSDEALDASAEIWPLMSSTASQWASSSAAPWSDVTTSHSLINFPFVALKALNSDLKAAIAPPAGLPSSSGSSSAATRSASATWKSPARK